MAGPSSRLDDCNMLEYLDTINSDSNFIPESDIDDRSDNVTTPAAVATRTCMENDSLKTHVITARVCIQCFT
jgi:hypothetical protein